MSSLKDRLEALFDEYAETVLLHGDSPEGRQALARIYLVQSMMERLEKEDWAWGVAAGEDEGVPLLSGVQLATAMTMPQ